MSTLQRVCVVIGVACVLGVAGLRHASATTSFTFTKQRWDGLATFLEVARAELGPERVVLEATVDWEQLSPEDALLVIHPETDLSFNEASAFLAAGGRIGLLDDFGRGADLLRRFHLSRGPPPEPAEMLRNHPALAIARPHLSRSESGLQLTHPVAEEVGFVVTNHPQALRAQPGIELTRVLTLPARSGEDAALAVVGVIGDTKACGLGDEAPSAATARCGRLFAMSDPSVFIDLMMRFEGNRKLAAGLVRYLTEQDVWGPRQGRLWIVANRFSQVGHFGGEVDLRRDIDAALESLRSRLRDLQHQGLSSRAALLLAFAAALAVCWWAWRTGGRLYQRPAPRYTREQPLVAQGGLSGRSAVLSAPTTTEPLRLVELQAAIESHLKAAFSLPTTASTQESNR